MIIQHHKQSLFLGIFMIYKKTAVEFYIINKPTTKISYLKIKKNLTFIIVTEPCFMTLKGSLKYIYLFIIVIKHHYHLWDTCVSQALP